VSWVLPAEKLEQLRDRLRDRGRARPSLVSALAPPDVVQAMEFVEEFGAICDLVYLVMLADRKIRSVEREVLRGALEIFSADRIRTAHMDAMLDASARKVARHGADACFDRAVVHLEDDPVKAEATLVVAAAVAAADGTVSAEKSALLRRLARTLGYTDARLAEVIGANIFGAST
jgi:tellurite resistance protein